MDRIVTIDGLEEAMAEALQDYSQEVTDNLKKEIRATSKEVVAELKETSPARTGEYAEGWTSHVEYEARDDIRVEVYNRKKPQITHVLENGHALVGGGRVEARPHITPAVDHAEKRLDKKIVKVVTQ